MRSMCLDCHYLDSIAFFVFKLKGTTVQCGMTIRGMDQEQTQTHRARQAAFPILTAVQRAAGRSLSLG